METKRQAFLESGGGHTVAKKPQFRLEDNAILNTQIRI
jgi:hypothetical protein